MPSSPSDPALSVEDARAYVWESVEGHSDTSLDAALEDLLHAADAEHDALSSAIRAERDRLAVQVAELEGDCVAGQAALENIINRGPTAEGDALRRATLAARTWREHCEAQRRSTRWARDRIRALTAALRAAQAETVDHAVEWARLRAEAEVRASRAEARLAWAEAMLAKAESIDAGGDANLEADMTGWAVVGHSANRPPGVALSAAGQWTEKTPVPRYDLTSAVRLARRYVPGCDLPEPPEDP